MDIYVSLKYPTSAKPLEIMQTIITGLTGVNIKKKCHSLFQKTELISFLEQPGIPQSIYVGAESCIDYYLFAQQVEM